MTMFASGMSMINRLRGKAAAVEGVFTWPTGETTTIAIADGVVPGASQQVSRLGPREAEVTVRIGHGERVLLVPSSALTKSGVETLPVLGLRWTETINGVSHRFQLRKTDAGPGWDWSDPSGRTCLRLHMRRDEA